MHSSLFILQFSVCDATSQNQALLTKIELYVIILLNIQEFDILGQKKLMICFSGTARVTFNPPASKIFIAFQLINVKNRHQITNYQFNLAAICLVYGWLVG